MSWGISKKYGIPKEYCSCPYCTWEYGGKKVEYCPITKQGYRVAGHDVYRKTADATPGWRKAMAKKLKKSTRQWARRMIKKEVV